MILNATLQRLDPPPGTPVGDAFVVRCAAMSPSESQSLDAMLANVALTLVVYVKAALLPPGVTPQVNGAAQVRFDADESETTLQINRVQTRAGQLGHAELWLAPLGQSGNSLPCSCSCEGEGGGEEP